MGKLDSVGSLINKIGWIPLMAVLGLLILPVFVMTERTTDPALIIRHLIPSITLLAALSFMLISKERDQWAARIAVATKTPFSILLLAFVLLKLISLSVAVNRVEVIFQASSSLLCFCIYVALSALLRKDEQGISSWYLTAVTPLNVVLLVFGIYGFYEVDLDLVKMAEVGSQMVNQNLFAPMFLFSMPFIMLAKKEGTYGWILWSILILDIAMILLLQNRATILALICGGGVFYGWKILNLSSIKRIPRWLRLSALIVIGLSIVIGSFNVLKKSQSFSVLLNSKGDLHTDFNSVTERFLLWNRTAMLFSDNPVLGVGTGNWPVRIGEYGISDPGSDRGSKYFIRPHNELLRIMSEHGTLGLIAVLMLLVILFRWIRIAPNTSSKPIYLAGGTAFLVISFFSFPTERMPLMMLVLMLLALAQTEIAEYKKEHRSSLLLPIAFALVAVVLSSYFYLRMENDAIATKMDEARRDKKWNRVLQLSEKIDQRFLNVNYFYVPIEFYSGLSLYHQGKIREASIEFTEALNHNPNHILTLTNLATCYSNLEQNDKAISTYKRALIINPNFEKANLNLAIAYYQNRQFEEAWKQLQRCKNVPGKLQRAIESAYLTL